MATQSLLLSPTELAYLHTSLSQHPPIRPDGRAPNQFRPLTAETGILPSANGSARVCFSDGTEAIVGVKAELEKTASTGGDASSGQEDVTVAETDGDDGAGAAGDVKNAGSRGPRRRAGREEWLEMTVEVPGQRDDDASTIFLAEMLREALLADGSFAEKLQINNRFHWRLFLDIILISPPLSYPLPLLSLTTHLALLATRLPRLTSEGDEDPMFDDDWEASEFLFPSGEEMTSSRPQTSGPPITLLVIAVGDNIIFDPSKEELAVAETALAVSVAEGSAPATNKDSKAGRNLRLVSIRTIDPPSRLTPPGVPNEANSATNGQGSGAATILLKQQGAAAQERPTQGVWRAPLGGTKFGVLDSMIQKVLEKGGVAEEVLDGLKGVDLV